MAEYTGYDFPIVGNDELGAELLPQDSFEATNDVFKSYNTVPVPKKTDSADGSFLGDFTTAVGSGITYPFKAAGGAASEIVGKAKDVVTSAIEGTKSTVRNAYLYLIGGVAIIGILAIVLLGAGSRVMSKVEGAK